MEEHLVCNSTGERITNDTGRAIFPCPKCGKQQIVRSSRARKLAIPYTCPGCGFIGPN
ncbi:MAG: zinc finger domain-containing protein [Nanoarchaeota archaeon]|nr:zinc finger domain-containing protein [Nanoarchaeota archaeon]